MKIIRKEMQGALLAYVGPGNTWQNNYYGTGAPNELEGWNGVFKVSGPRFYRQDTIDISGITVAENHALQPAFVECQQSPFYRAGGSATSIDEPTNYAWEIVMLTTVPFDADNWLRGPSGIGGSFDAFRLPTIFGQGQNASLQTLSADQCIYGRHRYLQNDFNTHERVTEIKGESFFGHPTPTMADELYLTRIIGWGGQLGVGALFEVPDIEICIHSDTTELSELSQIMELRRSYLTQQTI